jgi:N-methylhydantoinase B
VRAALNLPTGSMRHHPFLSFGLTSFVVTQSEAIHINAGIIRCIDLVLPEASVVNSRFPASCGMRITTAMRIHDMVLGALAQALPGRVPAGGGNTLVITYISTSELGTQGRVVVANPVPAGAGGGPDRDGISGTDFSCAMCRWRCWSRRRRCWCTGSACWRTPKERGDTVAGSDWNTNWRSAIRALLW